MGATNEAIMMRFIREYQVGRDETVLYDTVSPDFVNHTPMFPGASGGPAEVKAIFDTFHAGFDGFTVDVLHQVSDADTVMTHKEFSGRHTGEFLGIPATGRPVRFAVMDVVRIADGQIVEHWALVDQPTLLSQLGAAQVDEPRTPADQHR